MGQNEKHELTSGLETGELLEIGLGAVNREG